MPSKPVAVTLLVLQALEASDLMGGSPGAVAYISSERDGKIEAELGTGKKTQH
jgi:hypothetical protein